MMEKLFVRAINLLHSGDYTCVLCDYNRILTSCSSGILPLLSRIEGKETLQGMFCADRIIGRAAALLLIFGGVQAVHGDVMSVGAKALLEQAGIAVSYGTLTDCIINRKGDGPCPMEQAVADITNPAQAPAVLRQTLERLKRFSD